MNRIAKLMCLMALLVMVGTSCKKQEEKLTFTASLGTGEWNEEGEDKLYLVDRKMWFEKYDEVLLLNVDYDTPSESSWGRFYATEDGQNVTFDQCEGSPVLESNRHDAFFAYYPGEDGMAAFDFDGYAPEFYHTQHYPNYGCFRLMPTQDYRTVAGGVAIPKKALYAAAKDADAATYDGAHFSFSPIGGVLSLKFYNSKSTTVVVKSIKVEDPDRNLVGNVYMRVDRIDPEVLQQLLLNFNPESQLYLNDLNAYCQEIGYRVPGHNEGEYGDVNPELSHELTLNCCVDGTEYENGVQIGNGKSNATNFMIGVRPAAFYHGIKITVEYTENGTAKTYVKESTANLMIKPATVKKIAALAIN